MTESQLETLNGETDCRHSEDDVSRVRGAVSRKRKRGYSSVLASNKCVAWIPYRALASLISFALKSRSTQQLDTMLS